MELIFIVFFSVLPQRSSGRLKEALSDKTLSEEPNVHDEPVEDGVDFEVKIYFTPSEWSKMALLVKRHAQNALEDYQNAINKGIVSLFNVYEYTQLNHFVLLIWKFNLQVLMRLFPSS